jgi:hypothetical protein
LLLSLQTYTGSPVAVQTCGRFVPELALLYAIWRGQRWASFLLGGSFALVTLVALGVLVLDVWPWSADVPIGLWGAVLAAWSYVLFRSSALAAYQQHQRE